MIKPINGMQNDADAMYFLQWFTSIQDEKRDEQVFEAQTLQRKVDVSLFETASCDIK